MKPATCYKEIRNATFDDMTFIISLANKEGWNLSLKDAESFWAIDPGGFFIEEINSMPIGCISAVKYNQNFGFIGFYIVIECFRHQGYGIRLWNKALEYLGNISIGLDGVTSKLHDYEKSNFNLCYKSKRFEGRLHAKENKKLINLCDLPFEHFNEFDKAIFGLDRTHFLQKWITRKNSYALAKVIDEKIVGYGVIRKCSKGYKIAPLFADSKEIANEILQALVAKIGFSPFYLDIPLQNKEALDLAIHYNMIPVFETARMYKNNTLKQNIEKIFGITSFEVG
jgi:hypothetical protein